MSYGALLPVAMLPVEGGQLGELFWLIVIVFLQVGHHGSH